MRHLIGNGTPRGLQDRLAPLMAALLVLLAAAQRWPVALFAWHPLVVAVRRLPPSPIIISRYSAA